MTMFRTPSKVLFRGLYNYTRISAFYHVYSTMVNSSISQIEHPIASLDLYYPAKSYPMARRIKRDVHLHIGPTNSGKSYTALLAFKAAKSGYYAGPLRMLAREIYDRMALEHIPCNLITGDEILEKQGAQLQSCTIEMLNLNIDMDVAIIDEIQMLHDPERGAVWTQALLGVRAKQLHLCGDPNSEPLIKSLMEETGDNLTVHRYERLSPLEVIKAPLMHKEQTKKEKPSKGKVLSADLNKFYKYLEPGDCVVAFSKRTVQGIRDKIVAAKGKKGCCAIIYGSLPPEIRAEQARLFNNPDSGVDYLVASDAIGMGLNLAIKRIVFVSLEKYDGQQMRGLEVGEIKQIAGRAGRFKVQDEQKRESGKVICLHKKDSKVVEEALKASTPEVHKAYVVPPKQAVKSVLLEGDSLLKFSEAIKKTHTYSETGLNYRPSRSTDNYLAASLFDKVQGLTFDERLKLMDAPVSDDPIQTEAFKRMCTGIGRSRVETFISLFPELLKVLSKPATSAQALETVHKILSLYLWLSYRFPCNFTDRESAMDLRRLCEHQFNTLLRSKKSLVSHARFHQKIKSQKRRRHRFR